MLLHRYTEKKQGGRVKKPQPDLEALKRISRATSPLHGTTTEAEHEHNRLAHEKPNRHPDSDLYRAQGKRETSAIQSVRIAVILC